MSDLTTSQTHQLAGISRRVARMTRVVEDRNLTRSMRYHLSKIAALETDLRDARTELKVALSQHLEDAKRDRE